jgi:hypothetical protein
MTCDLKQTLRIFGSQPSHSAPNVQRGRLLQMSANNRWKRDAQNQQQTERLNDLAARVSGSRICSKV